MHKSRNTRAENSPVSGFGSNVSNARRFLSLHPATACQKKLTCFNKYEFFDNYLYGRFLLLVSIHIFIFFLNEGCRTVDVIRRQRSGNQKTMEEVTAPFCLTVRKDCSKAHRSESSCAYPGQLHVHRNRRSCV